MAILTALVVSNFKARRSSLAVLATLNFTRFTGNFSGCGTGSSGVGASVIAATKQGIRTISLWRNCSTGSMRYFPMSQSRHGNISPCPSLAMALFPHGETGKECHGGNFPFYNLPDPLTHSTVSHSLDGQVSESGPVLTHLKVTHSLTPGLNIRE